MCATCHAKMVPLSTDFVAGDKFYDHYDLITLEHRGFLSRRPRPGRELHLHLLVDEPLLEVGQARLQPVPHAQRPAAIRGPQANQSCLPCHAEIVANPTAHSHHKADSTGNSCIACHMPMSRFAAMARTDHSMRPPTPAATIAYKSPNACNQCHADHDAPWADQWVRKWYPRDYQAEPLRRAALLDAARKNDWKRLPEMLADVRNKQGDEIYRNSLVRLLRGCNDPQKWPVLIAALKDDSPLVRASAAAALEGYLTEESVRGAARAPRPTPCGWCGSAPRRPWPPCIPSRSTMPTRENRCAGRRRSSSRRWQRGPTIGPPIRTSAAITWRAATSTRRSTAFETALKLEPRVVAPMVNLSMAYANLKQNDKAEAWLRRALKAEPDNAAANFNLGLLLAETDRLDEAEKALAGCAEVRPAACPGGLQPGRDPRRKEGPGGSGPVVPQGPRLAARRAEVHGEPGLLPERKRRQGRGHRRAEEGDRANPRFFDGCAMLAGIYESRGERKAARPRALRGPGAAGFPPELRGAWKNHVEELEK